MIKFFRKIRQNLLSEGKTGKYIKYAIGEIVLVVIGILIALSINNWNENRKIEKNIDRVISLLEGELTQNINKATSLINRGDSIDSLANMYTQNLFTKEFLNKNPDIFFTIFTTPQIKFEHNHLDALISLEKQFPDNYNVLRSLIKYLKAHMEMQLFWENKSMDISLIRFKEFVDTQEWLYSDSKTNEMYAYINTNIFNNKLNHYLELQHNNIRHVSLTRDASVVTLWNIKKMKSKEYPDFNLFIKDLPLEPLFENECNNKPYKVFNSTFKRNLLIYNNTNNSIFINIINKDGQEKSRFNLAEIPSKGLYFGDGFFLRDDELIQVLKNGECYKVYSQDTEDYIIVN